MKCECKGCDKRTIGCHTTCPSYIAFKKEREEIRIKNYKEKISDYYSPVVKKRKR